MDPLPPADPDFAFAPRVDPLEPLELFEPVEEPEPPPDERPAPPDPPGDGDRLGAGDGGGLGERDGDGLGEGDGDGLGDGDGEGVIVGRGVTLGTGVRVELESADAPGAPLITTSIGATAKINAIASQRPLRRGTGRCPSLMPCPPAARAFLVRGGRRDNNFRSSLPPRERNRES